MTTKYDNDVILVFEKFKEENVVAKFSEKASLKTILGENLKGVSVLDIGCGFGYHARWIAGEGAVVTGVDCSEEEIKLALELEQKQPSGVNFLLADAVNLPKIHRYDVCLFMYVIQCANNETELVQFIVNASNNLKPGGQIIGVFNNCYDPKIINKYGYRFPETALSAKPGSIFTGVADVCNGEKSFVCNMLKINKEFMERVAGLAGFKNIVWNNPAVSAEGLDQYGEEFWRDFVTVPVDQYFTLTKESS